MQADSFPEQVDELIELLSTGLSVASDAEFFPTITSHLARLLNADYALIGELAPGATEKITTLSFSRDKELVENITYPLKETPCEQVLKNKASVFTRGLQQAFPKDKMLVELQADGYVGVPLKSAFGESLGIVCVLYRQSVPHPKQTEQLLKIFACRAGSELERRRDNDIMQQQEHGFRRFYERSPLSYQSLDAEGTFINVNPAWLDTFGYTRDEVIGQKFSDFMTDDSRHLVSERFPRLKKTGELRNADFNLLHKEGHTLQVTLHGRASYNERGLFLHTNCILIDVTMARKAEERLRRSEERNRLLTHQFQSLLDSIPDRILLLDPELRIVWTNQKKDLKNKRFTNNLRGRFCYEAMHGNSSLCPDCPAQACFNSGKETHFERINPDNKIWMQRAIPIFDDQGEVVNVVEIGQDITERVMLRKESARTGQLAALGELAAGVAHEINNPITGVINCAQLILNRSSEDKQEHGLAKRIIKEGDRIASIVNQLLFHAKDNCTDHKQINLTDTLSESLSLVGSQLNREGINLGITLAENLPKMTGHPQQLQQVFLNIISNARYALNKRFPQSTPDKRLDVNLGIKDTDVGSELVVRFHDQGIGIPANMLDKVLHPFFTSKPSAEGTGLGLSISHDILNSHGAALQIESKEGACTTVTIHFPV